MIDKPTVHKIMDVAIPLFAQKGFAGVSVKEIAEAANVNIALISYHFGGKENLYGTILEAQFRLVDKIINLISNEEKSPFEKIKDFSQEFLKLNKLHPYSHRLIYGEIINPTTCYESIVKPGVTRNHKFIVECIEAGINSGQIRSDVKSDCASLSFASVLNFYFFTSHLSNGFLETDQDKAEYYITEAIEMYLKSILNHSMVLEI